MSIFSDFIGIQKDLPPLVKDTQGDGYKYPTLNQLLDIVLPMCHSKGLGLMQVTHPVEGGVGVETVLFNDKNERLSSGILAMPLTTDGDGNIINVGGVKRSGGVYGQFGAQAYGSALSYARRYSLTAFFCMKAEDDDGQQASQRHQKQNPATPAKQDGLDMAKFEKAMRGATKKEDLDRFYQAGLNKADKNQIPAVNALYEELKAYFVSANEDMAIRDVHEAQMEAHHDDWGNRE